MKIQIANIFCPFSKQDTSSCLIPNTSIGTKIFPTFLELFDVDNFQKTEKIKWFLKGPILDFTTFLDIENEKIIISGKDQNKNYFRLFVYQENKKIIILCKRANQNGIKYKILSNNKILTLKQNKKISIAIDGNFKINDNTKISFEKLSFGVHKKQDIDLINRRLDFEEILPFIFLLGQKIPDNLNYKNAELPLLKNIDNLFKKNDKNNLENGFLIAYKQLFKKYVHTNSFR